MKSYLITQIVYDFGDEHNGFMKPSVPSELVLEAPNEITTDELEDYLANEISDKTGFCVDCFVFKTI